MGVRMRRQPKIFHVNWFRQGENGNIIWPGFGENLRILEWILARSRGDLQAEKTAIGFIPRLSDLNMTGIDLSPEDMKKLFQIDPAAWKQEMDNVGDFFKKFGDRLPLEFWAQHEALARRLDELGGSNA